MLTLALVLAVALQAPVEAGEVRVVVVRHAEPAIAKGDPDPGLSDEGRTRAACLAGLFEDEPLTHVFTSPLRRARETGAPAAAARKLEPATREPLEAKALAAELAGLPPGSVALVVGHSNTVPALVRALGGRLEGLVQNSGQESLPLDQFDRLIRLRLEPDANPEAAPRLVDLADGRQACETAPSSGMMAP